MKTLVIVLLALVLLPASTLRSEEFPEKKKAVVVDNLAVGLVSDNSGLRTSSANVISNLITEAYIDEGDTYKAMIPLLIMLEKGETECERICAAVALFKLGNGIGIYRLRGIALFDDNEKVSEICKNLYTSYHKLNGTEYLIDL